ncbi:lipase family protein [Rhodopila sp.]|jgi:triacylglycerol lipase|uniref:lipase family protein n=1 Tax=Rhodopila sp. TaxID=2480087 RepID=UPI002C790EAA|nr:lipase family protein [Rhodopila sp.]HVZ06967.1 lipase family protein [Rhodopila sp.]
MGFLTAFQETAYPGRVAALPGSPGFSLATAITLGWASQLAYEVRDEAKARRILGRWGWTGLTVLRGHFYGQIPIFTTFGYVARAGDAAVIAFAGTEPDNLLNWAHDLDIRPSANGITSGFSAAYAAVRQDVHPALPPAGPIYLAGHSLGGAIAVTAAYDLATDPSGAWLPRIAGVYTMGMPRAGTALFADAYDALLGDRTYRLVLGEDLVTRVPPAASPFDFRHVGHALACPHGGRFGGVPEPGDPAADLSLLAEVRTALAGATGPTAPELPAFPAANPVIAKLIEAQPRAIRDHFADRYLAALGAL